MIASVGQDFRGDSIHGYAARLLYCSLINPNKFIRNNMVLFQHLELVIVRGAFQKRRGDTEDGGGREEGGKEGSFSKELT